MESPLEKSLADFANFNGGSGQGGPRWQHSTAAVGMLSCWRTMASVPHASPLRRGRFRACKDCNRRGRQPVALSVLAFDEMARKHASLRRFGPDWVCLVAALGISFAAPVALRSHGRRQRCCFRRHALNHIEDSLMKRILPLGLCATLLVALGCHHRPVCPAHCWTPSPACAVPACQPGCAPVVQTAPVTYGP